MLLIFFTVGDNFHAANSCHGLWQEFYEFESLSDNILLMQNEMRTLNLNADEIERLNFRLWLQKQFTDRCKRNPRYSLRAFAKSLFFGRINSVTNFIWQKGRV